MIHAGFVTDRLMITTTKHMDRHYHSHIVAIMDAPGSEYVIEESTRNASTKSCSLAVCVIFLHKKTILKKTACLYNMLYVVKEIAKQPCNLGALQSYNTN